MPHNDCERRDETNTATVTESDSVPRHNVQGQKSRSRGQGRSKSY